MRAITVRDRDAGVGGLTVTDTPFPRAAENDVIVRVHAAGFTPGELDWPGTWSDRAGRYRTPTIPGHELSGAVVELGYRPGSMADSGALGQLGPVTVIGFGHPPCRAAGSAAPSAGGGS